MPCLAKFFNSVLNNIFICIPQGTTLNTFFHFTRAGSSCASLVVWFHVGMTYNVAVTFWWGNVVTSWRNVNDDVGSLLYTSSIW